MMGVSLLSQTAVKRLKPFKQFKKTSRKNTQGLNQPTLDLCLGGTAGHLLDEWTKKMDSKL
jgi:hypothetical protein